MHRKIEARKGLSFLQPRGIEGVAASRCAVPRSDPPSRSVAISKHTGMNRSEPTKTTQPRRSFDFLKHASELL
jgi:hypothetical protein